MITQEYESYFPEPEELSDYIIQQNNMQNVYDELAFNANKPQFKQPNEVNREYRKENVVKNIEKYELQKPKYIGYEDNYSEFGFPSDTYKRVSENDVSFLAAILSPKKLSHICQSNILLFILILIFVILIVNHLFDLCESNNVIGIHSNLS